MTPRTPETLGTIAGLSKHAVVHRLSLGEDQDDSQGSDNHNALQRLLELASDNVSRCRHRQALEIVTQVVSPTKLTLKKQCDQVTKKITPKEASSCFKKINDLCWW